MITYEQEHDFANWDLQLFNRDPYADCGYGGVVTLEDEEHCPANYFKEDCYDAGECCNIENDEAIAHTLQLQERSQLVVFESPNQGEEEELQLHAVSYPQDCIVDQSVILDRIGVRKSGMELTGEHALDGEVEKTLNQMVPLPFRALSDQFYRSPEHHEFLRQQVVNQYGVKIFVITSFKDTCYKEILPNVQRSKRVSFLSFWAESVSRGSYPLQIRFQKGIFLESKDVCVMGLGRAGTMVTYAQGWEFYRGNKGTVNLACIGTVDVPEFGTKKKKRWRMFRNKHLESQDEYQ
ncbi:hypothetical protein V6N12_075799 [Hibiscus sabdariffa]|uniref:Uncharacterized protein n=1 Tax=Hibiscus sabdariffa TaxID=183260 RepID=A0ABR2C935_9ROSI